MMHSEKPPRFYRMAVSIAACCALILLALYLQPVKPKYNIIIDDDDPDSNQRIHMGAGNDLAYGRGGADEIRGEEGDDQLFGNEGADRVSGGEGNDIIEGNEDDDTLIGNTGDDLLNGGIGSDTYIYQAGDGNDTIEGEGDFVEETDILELTGLNESDVTLTIDGDDLIVTINTTGETISITGQFASGSGAHGIESIIFANSSNWIKEDIRFHVGFAN